MTLTRTTSTKVLAILLSTLLLLCCACGQKPEPDLNNDNDVSTGTSADKNPMKPDDSTVESADMSTNEVTNESTDESVDDSSDVTDDSTVISDDTTIEADTTVTKGENSTSKNDEKVTTKSTTKNDGRVTTKSTTKNDGRVTTKSTTKNDEKITTKSTNKSTTKSTTKNSKPTTTSSTKTNSTGPIIPAATTTKTKTTPTSTTTVKPADASVKGEILSMFDSSMNGKTVKFLIHYVANSETEKLIQMYDETGVKIKFIIAEYETFGTRLTALINAKSSPDVAYFRSEQYVPMVNKSVMTDLRDYDIDLSSKVFDQELIEMFTWNGKKFGISTKNSNDANFTVMFYNKTKFDRIGHIDPGTLWKQRNWNWNTFVECAQAVNDPTNGTWGCELYDSAVYLCSGGVSIISMADGNIINNLTDQRINNAWTFINKLHHEYKVTTGLAGAENNFVAGKSAMLMGESWMWGINEPISQTKDEWGVVPAPLAPDVKTSAIINPRGICVPLGSKSPEAGIAAYVYWTSKDTYEEGEYEDLDREKYPYVDTIAMNAFYSELWDLPKIPDLSSAIIEYGGEYSRWDFSFDIFQAGMSGINANIDKWKSAIDINIRRIMTEFS